MEETQDIAVYEKNQNGYCCWHVDPVLTETNSVQLETVTSILMQFKRYGSKTWAWACKEQNSPSNNKLA